MEEGRGKIWNGLNKWGKWERVGRAGEKWKGGGKEWEVGEIHSKMTLTLKICPRMG